MGVEAQFVNWLKQESKAHEWIKLEQQSSLESSMSFDSYHKQES